MCHVAGISTRTIAKLSLCMLNRTEDAATSLLLPNLSIRFVISHWRKLLKDWEGVTEYSVLASTPKIWGKQDKPGGTEVEAPKASRGWRMGRGIPLPIQLESLGKRRNDVPTYYSNNSRLRSTYV